MPPSEICPWMTDKSLVRVVAVGLYLELQAIGAFVMLIARRYHGVGVAT